MLMLRSKVTTKDLHTLSFLLSAGGAAFIFPNTSVYPEATQRITTRPGTLTPYVTASLRDPQMPCLDPGPQPVTPRACPGPDRQCIIACLFHSPVAGQLRFRDTVFRVHSRGAKLWNQKQIRALSSSFEYLSQCLG